MAGTEPDDSAGDALRRSLGLKPRSAAPGESAAATAPSTGSSRTKDSLPSRAADLGLGVRRRSSALAADGSVPPPAQEPITDPVRKPVGKLNPDAQRLLRQWYMARPELDLPPFLHELPGTHGWYMGDGRERREVVVGFTPAFVLYTLPLYPDGPPEWVKGQFLMPGLPAQPEYTERGFVAPAHLNQINSMCTYVVWQSREPLAARPGAQAQADAPPDESPRDRRRREEMERRKRDLEARRARNEGSKRR